MPRSEQDLKQEFADRYRSGAKAVFEAYHSLKDETDQEDVVKARRVLKEANGRFNAALDLYEEGDLSKAVDTLPPVRYVQEVLDEAEQCRIQLRQLPKPAKSSEDESGFIKSPDKKSAVKPTPTPPEEAKSSKATEKKPVVSPSEQEEELPASPKEAKSPEKKSAKKDTPSNADILDAVRELKDGSLPDGYREVFEKFSPEDLAAVLRAGRWANQRRAKSKQRREERRGKYAANGSY